MALEASDRQIDIIWVNWRCTCGCISRPTFKLSASSSVQTIVRKYKHHGTTQPSYRSGRRRVLSPRDERTLVRKVQINPRTTDLVKLLEETGTKVSISTVKRVRYRHNLKGRSARKKPLLQNRHKKAGLWFATAHGDKNCTFWRNVLWSDSTKIELFGHNDHCYVWRIKGEACKPKNTIPNCEAWGWQHHVVGVLCCRRDWYNSKNRWHHEWGQFYGYIEATSQEISLKLGRKRVFQMDNDPKHTSKVGKMA